MQDTTTVTLELSGYEVRFSKLLVGWAWSATAPDGTKISPAMPGIYAARIAAERAALRAIREHAETVWKMNGDELRRRIEDA